MALESQEADSRVCLRLTSKALPGARVTGRKCGGLCRAVSGVDVASSVLIMGDGCASLQNGRWEVGARKSAGQCCTISTLSGVRLFGSEASRKDLHWLIQGRNI